LIGSPTLPSNRSDFRDVFFTGGLAIAHQGADAVGAV